MPASGILTTIEGWRLMHAIPTSGVLLQEDNQLFVRQRLLSSVARTYSCEKASTPVIYREPFCMNVVIRYIG